MQIAQANMAVMAGDSYRPGLEQIFLEHKELVYRAAYRVTGNSSDAEDVLQTVFLRLVRQEKFPEISNLPGYLHRSAVNASLDLLRGKKETFSLDEDPNQTEVVSTDHGPHCSIPAKQVAVPSSSCPARRYPAIASQFSWCA